MLAYEVSALLWELLWEQKTLFPIAAFSLLYPTKPDLAQVSFCPASVKTQTPEGDISTTTALVLIKSERLIVQLSYIESKVEIASIMTLSLYNYVDLCSGTTYWDKGTIESAFFLHDKILSTDIK